MGSITQTSEGPRQCDVAAAVEGQRAWCQTFQKRGGKHWVEFERKWCSSKHWKTATLCQNWSTKGNLSRCLAQCSVAQLAKMSLFHTTKRVVLRESNSDRFRLGMIQSKLFLLPYLVSEENSWQWLGKKTWAAVPESAFPKNRQCSVGKCQCLVDQRAH
jgi:hypothetical protein